MEIAERLRAAFTQNISLKVVAFAFSLVLYSLVHGSQDAQRSVSVPLVVILPPDSENRVLKRPAPAEVRLTLRGPPTVVYDLRAEDIGNLQVNVKSEKERSVRLEPRMVHAPAGVRVEQIDPPAIELEWDVRTVREIPVQVSVVGAPAAGFVVKAQVEADPTVVRVRGPQSEVSQLQFVRADAFDVQGLTEGVYTRTLGLDAPRGNVLLENSSVRATVTVAREVAERTFTRVPVAIVGPSKAKSQPLEVDVRLVCPPEIVRALRTEQIIARVDVEAKDPSGVVSRPVAVTLDRCQAFVTPPAVIVRW